MCFEWISEQKEIISRYSIIKAVEIWQVPELPAYATHNTLKPVPTIPR
jgi:hypothetical protein